MNCAQFKTTYPNYQTDLHQELQQLATTLSNLKIEQRQHNQQMKQQKEAFLATQPEYQEAVASLNAIQTTVIFPLDQQTGNMKHQIEEQETLLKQIPTLTAQIDELTLSLKQADDLNVNHLRGFI
ncbi:hypothetical protein [Legionella shakespearei]|uniref:Uncharacterized protein n=1 Tax=Legionella shakespearei DSM 23087 TaxID=1122169 RepID=A0A0W0Z2I3_9GAMM|nr:hypothetical protein [Legionella shakespearei]KTD63102.1 hypothetical protein Lsha_0788 [Legionella shakespearei DSM 23087]